VTVTSPTGRRRSIISGRSSGVEPAADVTPSKIEFLKLSQGKSCGWCGESFNNFLDMREHELKCESRPDDKGEV
jgi:hypothetical protein